MMERIREALRRVEEAAMMVALLPVVILIALSDPEDIHFE